MNKLPDEEEIPPVLTPEPGDGKPPIEDPAHPPKP